MLINTTPKMLLLLIGLLCAAISHSTVVQAFVDCAALPPCTCWGTMVLCANKNLDKVPSFHRTTTNYSFLYLYGNQISRLDDGVFLNLSTADYLYLRLDGNLISYTGNQAFSGLERTKLNLQLRNNRLSVLPKALSQLKNLTRLTIDDVNSLDPYVMSSIGPTLESLDIGMENMSEWPQQMEYLTKLESLTIRDVHFARFPDAALMNFHHSLKTFAMYSSTLYHSLDALCFLNSLTTLELNHLETSPNQLVPVCVRPISSVSFLRIESSSLVSFPSVFNTFPSLTSLIVYAPIHYMDDHVIPDDNMVNLFLVRSSKFTRIPPAIKKLKNLDTLYLNYNQISYIEAHDLSELPSLSTLYLGHNPLVFISEMAFGNYSTSLHYLELQQTALTSIPKTMLHLPSITRLFLEETQIKCTCSMEWLLTWDKLTHLNIYGQCYQSPLTISKFVKSGLQVCQPSPIGK